jgi:hypothetical protein
VVWVFFKRQKITHRSNELAPENSGITGLYFFLISSECCDIEEIESGSSENRTGVKNEVGSRQNQEAAES